MKSILINVMFPAWVWAHEEWASRKFMSASYAASLSVRDGIKMRMVIESPLYHELFKPKWTLRDDQNQKLKFQNTMSGLRFSTSIGGAVTGEGYDFGLIDDPVNALEANSELIREEANTWHDLSWSTRANNPNAYCRIYIMQRLHELDMTGHVISKKTRPAKRAHLIFQARFEPNSKVKSESPLPLLDPRKRAGELLWPERFDDSAINQLAADLDTNGLGQSHAQLQQDPRPKEGGLFKRVWWQRYDKSPAQIFETVQFWDCAQKPGITNDYSVCATWARCAGGYYLLDLWRKKVEAPELEATAIALYQKWRPDAIVPEDKSAGSSLIQYLRRIPEPSIPVLGFNPRGDKEVRASAAAPTVHAEKCFLPNREIIGHDEIGNPYNLIEAFITEHERFPKGAHDDMVDTTSMMVEYFSKRMTHTPRIRSL
jgi:predicted phage terminase large subunit-like protein